MRRASAVMRDTWCVMCDMCQSSVVCCNWRLATDSEWLTLSAMFTSGALEHLVKPGLDLAEFEGLEDDLIEAGAQDIGRQKAASVRGDRQDGRLRKARVGT